MSESPLKCTLKSGTGYDVPWLTVDADNPGDLEQKLRGIIDSHVMDTINEAASLFQATHNAVALTQPQAEPAPPQQAAPQSQGWGAAQQAPAQQQSAPQGGGVSQYGNQLHPEGKQCTACGNVLEYGKTRTNKGQWKCGAYRYNNGNPNEHTLEWA